MASGLDRARLNCPASSSRAQPGTGSAISGAIGEVQEQSRCTLPEAHEAHRGNPQVPPCSAKLNGEGDRSRSERWRGLRRVSTKHPFRGGAYTMLGASAGSQPSIIVTSAQPSAPTGNCWEPASAEILHLGRGRKRPILRAGRLHSGCYSQAPFHRLASLPLHHQLRWRSPSPLRPSGTTGRNLRAAGLAPLFEDAACFGGAHA